MTRITKEWLKARVLQLNETMGRPTTIYNPNATAGQQNIGHLLLDKDSTGYKLVEILATGGEASWRPRMTAYELDLFIDGIFKGIKLCTIAHDVDDWK